MIVTPFPRTADGGVIVTPVGIAQRFAGLTEIPGPKHNPLVVAMLQEYGAWIMTDEEAWCGAFAGFVCGKILGLQVPKQPLRARNWLTVGKIVRLADLRPGDLAIFKRGGGPGPEVLSAPGHVTFFLERDHNLLNCIGGNQSNRVRESLYHVDDQLGFRRL